MVEFKPCLTSRKSYILKAKLKAFKEVREGKQLTIKGPLREDKPC